MAYGIIDVLSGKKLFYSARSDHILTQILYALSKSEDCKNLFDEDGWMDFEGFQDFLHEFQKKLNFMMYPYTIDFSRQKAVFQSHDGFWDDLSSLVNTNVAEYKTQDDKLKLKLTKSGKHYAETTYIVYPELREFIDTIYPMYNPFFINVGNVKDYSIDIKSKKHK